MTQDTLIDVSAAPDLIRTLASRGETVAFCESLTAGLASATVAKVPGASNVLRGGLITYATDLKASLAGVPESVLEKHGPVAAVTARHMARGAREKCGATWGVALTGVAGPDPQDGHPVGEVHIAVSGPSRTVSLPAAEILAGSSQEALATQFALVPGSHEPVRVLVGQRQEIRELAVAAAIVAVLHETDREQKQEDDR
ncbi:CinA family protein [uncultured Corynebacterium sp.]|uniref:CinA family protein n=1 Tax=uncultured Corynebacterium sp. TaxID=159447 RepID=UPI0025F85B9A|nr:CinA family protein [uncultured Corynebacterium sp.]